MQYLAIFSINQQTVDIILRVNVFEARKHTNPEIFRKTENSINK